MEKKELKKVIEAVAAFTEIPECVIRGTSRLKEITNARHIFFYVAAKKTNATRREIGQFANRDHSTVTNSLKKMEFQINHYPWLKAGVNKVESLIK